MVVSHLPSVPTASSLRILTQLSERTTNCKDSWITVTISSLSWKKKNESKVSDRSPGKCLLLSPVRQSTESAEAVCWKPMLLCKQACSAHCYRARLYLLSYFLRSQTHSYLMKHRSLSFSFLYSAPLTFLSEVWKKKIFSYCCWGETKFNFWVGNWRIIHEQISSKLYDLLNFGLWFIFMYSCYCYKVVPASIRSWMRSF